jgi:hypothetical protein
MNVCPTRSGDGNNTGEISFKDVTVLHRMMMTAVVAKLILNDRNRRFFCIFFSSFAWSPE